MPPTPPVATMSAPTATPIATAMTTLTTNAATFCHQCLGTLAAAAAASDWICGTSLPGTASSSLLLQPVTNVESLVCSVDVCLSNALFALVLSFSKPCAVCVVIFWAVLVNSSPIFCCVCFDCSSVCLMPFSAPCACCVADAFAAEAACASALAADAACCERLAAVEPACLRSPAAAAD